MPRAKYIALKTRLHQLRNHKEASQEEIEFLIEILKAERSRSEISRLDEQVVNEYEVELLKKDGDAAICICKTDDAPQVHHLKKDAVCYYKFNPDIEGRDGKNNKSPRIEVYVPHIIPSLHQATPDIAFRLANKIPVDPKELPEPKAQWHRIVVSQREFDTWFTPKDDLSLETHGIANNAPKDEEFVL